MLLLWYALGDSNPRLLVYQTSALTNLAKSIIYLYWVAVLPQLHKKSLAVSQGIRKAFGVYLIVCFFLLSLLPFVLGFQTFGFKHIHLMSLAESGASRNPLVIPRLVYYWGDMFAF